MATTFTILTKELQRLGLPLPEGSGRNGKLLRSDFEDAIANYHFQRNERTLNETLRMQLHSVQLAYRFDALRSSVQDELFQSENWILEEKYDGARIVLIYNPVEGFGVFGRNRQRKTCLPMNYTHKLLLPSVNDGLINAKDFAGKLNNLSDELKHGFILDCELIALNTSKLNAINDGTTTLQSTVSSLLALNVTESHAYQRNDITLKPVVFDILPVDTHCNIRLDLQLRERVELLHALFADCKEVNALYKAGIVYKDKQSFYEQTIKKGKEGVVFKNMNSLYTPGRNDYRSRYTCVKLKRKLTDAERVSDIDAFIIGYTLGPEYSKYGLIAGVKLGVYVKQPDGTQTLAHIATVSGIPAELRRNMSHHIGDKITLNEEYMHKVITVNGQDISSLNKRITHAVALWGNGFRNDKSYTDCVLDSDFIDSQIF